MEDFDPRLLRAFLHVARERSFSAAARSMGLSPSTVSLRVRTLEKRLGTDLFHRGPHGLTPAPSVSGLLPAAREIVEMHDRLFERAASMSVPESAAPGLPPPAAPATPDP
ncbi:MAG: LysR family transcriptional regulator [Alphaproteobacteria bacterium]|nr:LysR family transcriptional regulator [Alphaproteobacteria bacterium]